MRLWSLHPHYLDRCGLVACWREALLARKVLAGNTVGYRNHPQLQRLRNCVDPLQAINYYLQHLYLEATERGYKFDRTKFDVVTVVEPIPVTEGQLLYELEHLRAKITLRDPQRLTLLPHPRAVIPHPLFTVHPGDIEPWERSAP